MQNFAEEQDAWVSTTELPAFQYRVNRIPIESKSIKKVDSNRLRMLLNLYTET